MKKLGLMLFALLTVATFDFANAAPSHNFDHRDREWRRQERWERRHQSQERFRRERGRSDHQYRDYDRRY